MTWWLLASAVAATDVTLEHPPRVGDETVIAAVDDRGDPRAGLTVRVFHRPGLTGQRESAVGITDGRGRVRWTPERPGVTEVRVGDTPLTVRVGYASTPPSVPLLLVLLALAGLGTLAYGVGLGQRRRS